MWPSHALLKLDALVCCIMMSLNSLHQHLTMGSIPNAPHSPSALQCLSVTFLGCTRNEVFARLMPSFCLLAALSQAYGACSYKTLGLVLQRSLLICWVTCLPVSLLYAYAEPVLLVLGQKPTVAKLAARYAVNAASCCVLIRTFRSFSAHGTHPHNSCWQPESCSTGLGSGYMRAGCATHDCRPVCHDLSGGHQQCPAALRNRCTHSTFVLASTLVCHMQLLQCHHIWLTHYLLFALSAQQVAVPALSCVQLPVAHPPRRVHGWHYGVPQAVSSGAAGGATRHDHHSAHLLFVPGLQLAADIPVRQRP